MTISVNLPDPERAATRLISKAGIAFPPVDLGKLVALWKNLFVVEEDLDGSGYLLPVGELGAEILVNSRDPADRKRFTVAHELGHWVLGMALKRKQGSFRQPTSVPRTTVERWCDSFATNVLMPRALVEGWITRPVRNQVLDKLPQAAEAFGVSGEAFYIRAWEVLRLQVVLLAASRNGGGLGFDIERSYADRSRERELRRILDTPGVQTQLQGASLVLFSLNGKNGQVRCVGKRLDKRRLMLVVEWPDLLGPPLA